MTPSPLSSAVGLLLSLALLSACTTVPEMIYQDPRVESLGRMDNLAVTSLTTADKNGFIAIQAEITNYDTMARTVNYRFRWMEPSGVAVGEEEAWKVAVLQPLDKKYIHAVAPTRQVADFRMVVQGPENTVYYPNETPGNDYQPSFRSSHHE